MGQMAKNSERSTLGVRAGQQVIVSQLEQTQARVPANLPRITMRVRSVSRFRLVGEPAMRSHLLEIVTAMTIVIEYYIPDKVRKQCGKWIPPEQRGKIILFPAPETKPA